MLGPEGPAWVPVAVLEHPSPCVYMFSVVAAALTQSQGPSEKKAGDACTPGYHTFPFGAITQMLPFKGNTSLQVSLFRAYLEKGLGWFSVSLIHCVAWVSVPCEGPATVEPLCPAWQ